MAFKTSPPADILVCMNLRNVRMVKAGQILISFFWTSGMVFAQGPLPAEAPQQKNTPGFSVMQPAPEAAPQQNPSIGGEAQKMLQQLQMNPEVQKQMNQMMEGLVNQVQQSPSIFEGPQGEFFEKFQTLLSDPKTEKFAQMVADPEFARVGLELISHPNWKLLAYLQIGLLLILFVFREWRYSRLEKGKWLGRVWIGLWTLGVYWTLALVALPALVLGDPYVHTLRGFYKILTGA